MEHAHYCREVEAHLCRKNDGHLIRIVGPAFELVRGWAERGIPLKIVERGIDRYFERYYAKGPRRRPVQIDFCEADVRDAFDEWRRAVGASGVAAAGSGDALAPRAKPRHSLAAHLDRVAGRLAARQTDPATPALNAETTTTLDVLGRARAAAARARGTVRAALVEDLAALDRRLLTAARGDAPAALRRALEAEAVADLEPFRDRMATDLYQQAVEAATDRLLRERFGLPAVRYED